MKAFYNDTDDFVCAWLSNLMDDGLITAGKIDDRSILDVSPDDLEGYERVHFFAGIGGWELALQYAGWEGEVWTGSCPCQPLSGAGLRKGHADERHLWPAFQSLIAECKPPVCFGEQVASKDGREWLAGVRADLESMGYACGAADLPAASVGAPHIRARLWWVADATELFRNVSNDYTGSYQRSAESVPEFGNGYRNEIGDGSSMDMGEPPIFVLAHEVPALMGATAAYGNAIVPQVAAEFIAAYMEAT